MKITLTYPRFNYDSNLPLGIAYIASYLREKGIKSNVIDQTFEGRATLERNLKKANPDILGLSTCTLKFLDSIEIAKLAKKINPNVIIIMGNAHPPILPEIIKNDCLDILVRGESEIIFLSLSML